MTNCRYLQHKIEQPSIQIDAAICDLIVRVNEFSDNQFDTHWMNLNDIELEALIVLLIQHTAASLSGSLLSQLLGYIRNEDNGEA